MVVTWVAPADVEAWLGVTAVDPTRLAEVTAAANGECFRARAYWYSDDPAVVPDEVVREGVLMHAGRLYRNRGVIEGMATFPSGAAIAGGWRPGRMDPDVEAKLGVPRAMAV